MSLAALLLPPSSFDGVDIALFSAGGSISKKLGPAAQKAGCVVSSKEQQQHPWQQEQLHTAMFRRRSGAAHWQLSALALGCIGGGHLAGSLVLSSLAAQWAAGGAVQQWQLWCRGCWYCGIVSIWNAGQRHVREDLLCGIVLARAIVFLGHTLSDGTGHIVLGHPMHAHSLVFLHCRRGSTFGTRSQCCGPCSMLATESCTCVCRITLSWNGWWHHRGTHSLSHCHTVVLLANVAPCLTSHTTHP